MGFLLVLARCSHLQSLVCVQDDRMERSIHTRRRLSKSEKTIAKMLFYSKLDGMIFTNEGEKIIIPKEY